jgi:hypothetical protein
MIYKNGASIKVTVQPPPKNWCTVEPNDVIRLSFRNKQYTGRQAEEMLMRPDEAITVIKLLLKGFDFLKSQKRIDIFTRNLIKERRELFDDLKLT